MDVIGSIMKVEQLLEKVKEGRIGRTDGPGGGAGLMVKWVGLDWARVEQSTFSEDG